MARPQSRPARAALCLKLSGRLAPLALAVAAALQPALAAEQALDFNIPPQSLGAALNAYADKANVQMSYPAALTADLKSSGVSGRLTPRQALQKLLAGTGISASATANGTVTLEKKAAPATPSPAKPYAPQSDATVLPTVTVTAKPNELDSDGGYKISSAPSVTKTDVPIFDTPASIQVVSKALIQDQQATTLDNALQNVSGVFRNNTFYAGDSAWSSYILRGFATSDRYVNGVRMPDNAYDMSRVERVEVLKGASGMLFGQMDPGGVINIVTKKPQETPGYSIQQQFGSYGFYRTNASATGPLGQDHNLYYGLDLTYQDAQSFRDFVYDNRLIITPTLSWRPMAGTEFNLTYQHRDVDLFWDSGIPAINGRIPNVPITRVYNQPGFGDNAKGDFLDFNWSHQFNSDWKISNGVAVNWNRYAFKEIPIAFFQPLLDSDNLVRRGLWVENGDSNSQTVYLNLNGKFNTGILKHNILLGMDYFSKSDQQSGYFVLGVPLPKRLKVFTYVDAYKPVYPAMDPAYWSDLASNSPNDFSSSGQSWIGTYFQDQITLWDKLHILGGGRYDWARSELNAVTGAAHLDPAANSVANLQNFAPRVGLVYEPTPWLALFGNRVESFHLQNASYRSVDGNPLAPETSTQYEVGFKTQLFDNSLSTNVSFYDITKQNVATQVDQNTYNTIGEAKSQGAEVDISGQITDSLSLNASYAYTDARITKDVSSGNEGKYLPNVPRNSGSLWVKYDFLQENLQGLSVGGGVYPTGTRWADNANSFRLAGYVRADLFAAYRYRIGGSWLTAQVNVRNLFDKTYSNNTASSPYMNMPGDPRTVMGSLKIEF